MKWLVEGRGGIFLGSDSPSVQSVRTDDYLRSKYGEMSQQNSLVYGGVQLDEDENKALMLPPNFALYEEVNVSEMKLEAKRTGVKLRWTEREKEEQGEDFDEIQNVYDTNFWVKGSNKVEFRNMRVTNMKNNRRLITPGPIYKDNFELKWRCVEDQCVEAAKSVNM